MENQQKEKDLRHAEKLSKAFAIVSSISMLASPITGILAVVFIKKEMTPAILLAIAVLLFAISIFAMDICKDWQKEAQKIKKEIESIQATWIDFS